ncbi:MAG TPA: class I SAM-dependent methyltransferase [Candidatus Binatia bacterium]|nr:class I SAM-dependent methyltransferase [Candidatus Binatia bacterium]
MSDTQSHLDAVREQFTRQAEVYAHMQHAADTAAFRQLVSLAQPQPHHKVLDVACGPGFLTMTFAEYCAHAVGLDATDKFLALAQAEARRRGLRNLTFHRGDAGQLPFAEGVFDIVVCRAAFHHMPWPDCTLAEMKRVAKGAGRLLICDMLASEDPHKAAYHNRLERLCDPSHARALPESEFERLFARAGLQVVARPKSPVRMAVDEWLKHGGPSEQKAQEILRLLEASLDGDQTGLRIERDQSTLYFNHTVVTFVATPAPPP